MFCLHTKVNMHKYLTPHMNIFPGLATYSLFCASHICMFNIRGYHLMQMSFKKLACRMIQITQHGSSKVNARKKL